LKWSLNARLKSCATQCPLQTIHLSRRVSEGARIQPARVLNPICLPVCGLNPPFAFMMGLDAALKACLERS